MGGTRSDRRKQRENPDDRPLAERIRERIAANNRVAYDGYEQGNLDGRVEAYEDVLRMLGVIPDER